MSSPSKLLNLGVIWGLDSHSVSVWDNHFLAWVNYVYWRILTHLLNLFCLLIVSISAVSSLQPSIHSQKPQNHLWFSPAFKAPNSVSFASEVSRIQPSRSPCHHPSVSATALCWTSCSSFPVLVFCLWSAVQPVLRVTSIQNLGWVTATIEIKHKCLGSAFQGPSRGGGAAKRLVCRFVLSALPLTGCHGQVTHPVCASVSLPVCEDKNSTFLLGLVQV